MKAMKELREEFESQMYKNIFTGLFFIVVGFLIYIDFLALIGWEVDTTGTTKVKIFSLILIFLQKLSGSIITLIIFELIGGAMFYSGVKKLINKEKLLKEIEDKSDLK